jgi:hypothetical protein
METRFTDDEKGLLEQAFQLRESQTEEQRAIVRAEFEVNWPALVAYVKQSEARGEKMMGDVLFALGESQDGPSIEKIVVYARPCRPDEQLKVSRNVNATLWQSQLVATSALHSMYGPPPNCKRFEVGRKDSPRKCIRPLSGELLSGHLMMIRTCRSF